jgi:urease accessory protein
MVEGSAAVSFCVRDGTTALSHLYQSDPLRILFPRPERCEPATGVLVTTSGGLVGGDRLDVKVTTGAGAKGRVLGQAAEKIYRSTGADSHIDIHLEVARDGWLEWMPQETIVFENARLRRLTVADVAAGARLLAGEIVVFGRTAMGEQVTQGLVRDAWEVYRNGRLVWADALHVEETLEATLGATSGFDGAVAFASLVYVGDDAADHLIPARDLLAATGCDGSLRAGVTHLGDVLVIRWLGRETRHLREAYGGFWAAFRHHLAGYPNTMPRLWHI